MAPLKEVGMARTVRVEVFFHQHLRLFDFGNFGIVMDSTFREMVRCTVYTEQKYGEFQATAETCDGPQEERLSLEVFRRIEKLSLDFAARLQSDEALVNLLAIVFRGYLSV